mgnify:CR=1 FL=1
MFEAFNVIYSIHSSEPNNTLSSSIRFYDRLFLPVPAYNYPVFKAFNVIYSVHGSGDYKMYAVPVLDSARSCEGK